MNVAVIPARGGSKRIVHKNLRPFCGHPIIEYSIRAARDSGLFTQILVSTDCPDIAAAAQRQGVQVLTRPAELSDDVAPLMPVVKHAIEAGLSSSLESQEVFVCCLLATAPLVTADDLKRSFALLKERPEADFVVPVTSFAYPIWRGLEILDDRLSLIWPKYELTRSQDLPETFHDAGQFYWGARSAWLSKERIFSSNAIPFRMSRHQVQDLDTLEDWERAERMYLASQRGSNVEP